MNDIPKWVSDLAPRGEEIWRAIPSYMHPGIDLYVQHGKVGEHSFLRYVLENNLVDAIGKADDVNRGKLFEYASLLYNCFPSRPVAWGSPKAVRVWCAIGGLVGAQKPEGWTFKPAADGKIRPSDASKAQAIGAVGGTWKLEGEAVE